VKDTLVSVIIFCLILVVVTAFATLAFAVYLIGSRLFLLPAITPQMLLALVPASLRQVFLPATLLSLFFALVRMRRKPGLVFLSYLLLGALAFGVLFLGPKLVAAPLNAEIAKVRSAQSVGLRDLAEPGKLIPFKDAYLYFDRKEGADLVSGFLIDQTKPAPRVVLFDRATVSVGADATRLTLPLPAGSRTLLPQTGESAPFAPDSTVVATLGFFQGLNDRFLALAGSQTTESIIVCVLFVMIVLSASLFLRATRWPLANVFLTLLVLALVLALYIFVVYQFLGEVRKVTGDTFLLTLAPNALLGFLALVFFLFDFVFLPERKPEQPHA
jgi:hypothetical protein